MLVFKIMFFVILWFAALDLSCAGSTRLYSRCYLVDINMFFNTTTLGHTNSTAINHAIRNSQLKNFITNIWRCRQDTRCAGVNISYENFSFHEKKENENLVLAGVFSYKVGDMVKKEEPRSKIFNCISGIIKKHDDHFKKYNLISSYPVFKNDDGETIRPIATTFSTKRTFCCEDTNTCCFEGSTLVHTNQRSYCVDDGDECKSQIDWTVKGVFSWINAKRGTLKSHECPYGPANLKVERECVFDPDYGAVKWGKLNASSCIPSTRTVSLLKLSQENVTTSNAVNVSKRLVLETKDATKLNAYDVALATDSLYAVISVRDRLEEVIDNIMIVLNNILMTDNETLIESQQHNRTTTRLLRFIERFAENIPLKNGSRFLTVTNLKISIQSPTMQMVREGASFKVNDPETIKNTAETIKPQPYMVINSQAFRFSSRQNSSRLIFVMYKNTKLFPIIRKAGPTRKDPSTVANPGTKNVVGSVVMAGKFKNAMIKDIEGAVELNFVPKVKIYGQTPLCVYWDFKRNDGFGNWSSNGCSVVLSTATDSDYVKCRCNHMTNFAMLLTADPEKYESDQDHRVALSVISYVGCSISFLGALLTFLTYALFKHLRRSNAQLILLHLCVSLIGLLISFLVVAYRTPTTTSCRAASIMVHYFLLATFAWMAVEGVNMYLAFVKVMSAHVPRFMPKAIVLAWGTPAIVVIITASVAFDGYSSEKSCFLHGITFYVSVLTPAIVVLVFNLFMFGLTMYSLSQIGKNTTQQNKLQGYRRIKSALAIMVLLGLTWLFGIMAIGSVRLLFQYLFCIFNSLQGFAIFWFHCLRQSEVRECWADFVLTGGSRRRRYTATTTLPAIKKSSGAGFGISPNPLNDTRDRQQSNADLNSNNLAV